MPPRDDHSTDGGVERESSSPWKRLRTAAWISFAIHFIAGSAMALILRHGLGTNTDLEARFAFIAERRVLWTGGWLT